MTNRPDRDRTWERPREAIGMFLRGHTLRTAGPTALVVGTILSVVNHGDVLVSAQATTSTWVRLAVNFAVPYVVASIGYLAARRAKPPAGDPEVSDR